MANSFNGPDKDGKQKNAVIPKKKIKAEVLRKINKRKYGLMLKYFYSLICLGVYILYLLMLILSLLSHVFYRSLHL